MRHNVSPLHGRLQSKLQKFVFTSKLNQALSHQQNQTIGCVGGLATAAIWVAWLYFGHVGAVLKAEMLFTSRAGELFEFLSGMNVCGQE